MPRQVRPSAVISHLCADPLGQLPLPGVPVCFRLTDAVFFFLRLRRAEHIREVQSSCRNFSAGSPCPALPVPALPVPVCSLQLRGMNAHTSQAAHTEAPHFSFRAPAFSLSSAHLCKLSPPGSAAAQGGCGLPREPVWGNFSDLNFQSTACVAECRLSERRPFV